MQLDVEITPLRRWMLLVGPLLAAAAGFGLCLGGHDGPVCWTAAITVLCAAWWVTEALPIPATSLIPLALLPLTGVLDRNEVSNAYGHYLILLLMGGFMLSKAMEKTGTHEKVALAIMRLVGANSPRRLILGFMIATATISMWVSNTATTLAMLPVALATLALLDDKRVAVPLLLGIAFAANIGGIGTPIGTPPNVVFMGQYDELLATGGDDSLRPWSFARWMMIGIPVVAVFVPLTWWWLTRGLSGGDAVALPEAKRWTSAQRRVLVVFAITALLWIFRSVPFGGWSAMIGVPKGIGDSTVAALMVIVMFLIPDGRGSRLLDWKSAGSIPWGILLLFGGGIALAQGFKASGLSDVIAAQLVGVTVLPEFLMILVICLVVTFLTEVTSNTAITVLLMPILAAAGQAAGIDPARLMIPAAMSASCAFMMPVATAPNAVIFGTGRIPMRRMNLEGVGLNIIGAVVITVITTVAL
ncbi:MAG: SLC13 family permease [Phycisphaerales bacterium]|nr:SLC13 family permease [Phycisphaerales bacterium]